MDISQPLPISFDPDTGDILLPGETPQFLTPEAQAAEADQERQKRVDLQSGRIEEFEEAREQAERRRQEAELSGRMSPAAQLYHDLAIAPQVVSSIDFTPSQRVPVIQGLLDRDTVNWIAAGSGSFKSFVAGDLAFRYGAEDMDYYGMKMTHGRALIVLAEGAPGYAFRQQAWEKHHDRQVKDVWYLPHAVQLGQSEQVSALVHYLRTEAEAGREFGMVIIDTQAMSTVGIDENGSEMNSVITQLGRIRDVASACVVVVHHFGKDARSGMRGSSMLYAAADTIIVTKRDKKKTEGGKDEPLMSVTLSTSPADNGKQKDLVARGDFLKLEMVSYRLAEDFFGDPITSLCPVADAGGSSVTYTDEGESAAPLPDVTDKQMPYLRVLGFYELDGSSPSGMAARMNEQAGSKVTYGSLVRNKMVELKRLGLAEQPTPKGPWFITPRGVGVIARDIALRQGWVDRAAPRRGVSQEVSGGAAKPLGETFETSAKPEAKLALTCDETSGPKNET